MGNSDRLTRLHNFFTNAGTETYGQNSKTILERSGQQGVGYQSRSSAIVSPGLRRISWVISESYGLPQLELSTAYHPET
ncbi:hypothetical protein Tco_1203252 [Tanacetum coccineum]